MSEILGLFIIIIVLSFVIWLLILIIGWMWNWNEILSKDICDMMEIKTFKEWYERKSVTEFLKKLEFINKNE